VARDWLAVVSGAVFGTLEGVIHKHCRIKATGELLAESAELTALTGFRRMVLYHERLAPGRRSSSPHSHSHREEVVIVLRGQVRAWDGAEPHLLSEGGYVAFRAGAGVPHWIENIGTETATYLLVASHGHDDEVTTSSPETFR